MDDAVRQAIAKGVRYLWSTQQADGGWKSYTAHNVGGPGGKPMPMDYRIGPTAICVYALLESGVSPADPRLTKALEYLLKEDTDKTYGRAFRCLALSTAIRKDKDNKHPLHGKLRQMLRLDAKTLILSMKDDGGYAYYSKMKTSGGKDDDMVRFITDHSNSQYGLLGVWAAALANEEIPVQFWQKSLNFWKGIQNADGGWGYTKQSRTASEISMTLAGVASLFVCIDNLHNQQALTCKGNQEIPQVTRGMEYIGQHFDDIRNRAWFYYALYGAERVAFATGYKYYGKLDWYKRGRSELLRRQEPDGHWTVGAGPHGGGPDVSTSYALLFLVRGSRPVVFNRLEYDGDWNNRPRSLANLTRWFSDQFENELYWQIVNFKTKADKWHDAPLLVITGATAPKFTDAQLAQLREFVDQGGTILSIDECGSIAFRKTMRSVYEKLFPGRTLERLPRTHPIYMKPYPLYGSPPLQIVSNGVRPLAIHTDLDLARAWQAGNYNGWPTYYKAAANIVAYVSAQTALSGQLHSRGTAVWPEEPTTLAAPDLHRRAAQAQRQLRSRAAGLRTAVATALAVRRHQARRSRPDGNLRARNVRREARDHDRHGQAGAVCRPEGRPQGVPRRRRDAAGRRGRRGQGIRRLRRGHPARYLRTDDAQTRRQHRQALQHQGLRNHQGPLP